MKKIALSVASAAFVIFALSACTTSAVSEPSTPSAEASLAPTPSPSFAEPAPSESSAPTTYSFGGATTYEDGVSISVSEPVAFTPGQYAAGGTQPVNVIFNFTITNNSSVNLEPFTYTRVSSGGVEGESVYDSDQNLSGGPSAVILPGQTISWSEGWNITDVNSITLQVSPSFDYEDAIFTNIQ